MIIPYTIIHFFMYFDCFFLGYIYIYMYVYIYKYIYIICLGSARDAQKTLRMRYKINEDDLDQIPGRNRYVILGL
jgi:hypothetical protein